jgi:Uma2 family endonuclease
MPRDDQVSSLPFCLAENVTLKQFHAKCDRNDSSGCFWWEFKNGKVWIYEFPLAAHNRAAGEIIFKLRVQMGQHMDDIISAASPRCDNNANNWSYEPDGSLTVRNSRPGPGHADAADQCRNRWPNIIVEVAFRESETHVRAKAIDWLETATDPTNGVQQVIVIKFGTTMPTDRNRTMKAWRYERGAAENPVQTIEFGNQGPGNGATEAGLDGMQLHIPVSSVYLPNAPPADLLGPLVLDLFYIRRVIEYAFGTMG